MSGHVTSADIPCTVRPEQMRPGRHRALAQALRMQEVLYDQVLNSEAKLAEKAQAARAWDALEDRKRELRGRPKAGMRRLPTEAPKAKGVKLLLPPTEEP